MKPNHNSPKLFPLWITALAAAIGIACAWLAQDTEMRPWTGRARPSCDGLNARIQKTWTSHPFFEILRAFHIPNETR